MPRRELLAHREHSERTKKLLCGFAEDIDDAIAHWCLRQGRRQIGADAQSSEEGY